MNTLRSEHLANGELPIMASIEGYDALLLRELPNSNRNLIFEAEENAEIENVEYNGDNTDQKFRGFLVGGTNNYTISPISSLDKVSAGYIMCLGTAAIGRDKETFENISFLSHQFPDAFLPGNHAYEKFVTDIERRLKELKEQCVPGSVDAVIFGGRYRPKSQNKRDIEVEYILSVKLLKREIEKILGFEPVAMTGPKILYGSNSTNESVLLDTKNRRLYISRPKIGDTSTQSYLAGEVREQFRKWKKEP